MYDTVESIPYGFRLLVDLFDHEVLIAALFSCFSIPCDMLLLYLYLVAVEVVEVKFARKYPYRVKVINVIDVTGILQTSRYVGGEERLPVCCSDYHRAILAGSVDLTRIVLEHQGECI